MAAPRTAAKEAETRRRRRPRSASCLPARRRPTRRYDGSSRSMAISARAGRRHRRARRRRADAPDPASHHERAEADLRHESRLGRLPDERIRRPRFARAPPRAALDHPSAHHARDRHNGVETTARAINEVSLLRQNYQAAKLGIEVDGAVRLSELIADGVLVSTPAGSTAYNLSANGPILPLGAPLMALTPISAFRPRRWRGALLPDRARVDDRGAGNGQAPGRRRRRPLRNPRRVRSKSRWIRRPRWSCCTTPAIRSTNGSCASSSATELDRRPARSPSGGWVVRTRRHGQTANSRESLSPRGAFA